MLNPDTLLQYVELQALSLDELFTSAYESEPAVKSRTDLACKRLSDWCKSSANGDWTIFNERLARDDLRLHSVLEKLSGVRRSEHYAEPPWLKDAAWIFEILTDTKSIYTETEKQSLNFNETYPFEHLFYEVAGSAEQRLLSGPLRESASLLSDEARRDLRSMLLQRICELSSRLLYELFEEQFRTKSSQRDSANENKDSSTHKYDEFLYLMRTSGFKEIFQKKPVFLRLLSTVTRQWIDCTAEFISRLSYDLEAIRKSFDCDLSKPIESIKWGLSDLHNNGRSVMVIQTSDKKKFLYKPKSLDIDDVWVKLIEDMNNLLPPFRLLVPKVIKSLDGQYGWAEFIESVDCVNSTEIETFYNRAGCWLALFHIFCSTDMHEENLIAFGSYPTPVDLEMSLQASSPERELFGSGADALNTAWQKILDSVSMTGLLPSYGRTETNEIQETGGLANNKKISFFEIWENINTDLMQPKMVEQEISDAINLPKLNGKSITLAQQIPNLIIGFERYANFLLENKGVILSFKSFARLSDTTIRKVFRPTRFYSLLLRRLKDHRNWSDGIKWSAQADFISRLVDWNRKDDPVWPFLSLEREALLNLNVPHFSLKADGSMVFSGNISVATQVESGFTRAENQLKTLSAEKILWQVEIIKLSTEGLKKPEFVSDSVCNSLDVIENRGDISYDAKVFLREAEIIARLITKNAIIAGSSAAWIGLDWMNDSDVSQVIPLGAGLYNGNVGISIFLAAYGHVCEDNDAKSLSKLALSNLRYEIKGANFSRISRMHGIGAASGIGGFIYGLSVIGSLLDEEELFSDASHVANLITSALIEADKGLDLIKGSAGAILALLKLFKHTGDLRLLDRAVCIGEFLLAIPRTEINGHKCWGSLNHGYPPINGMSHGASGFALALSSLAHASAREDFHQAAVECIDFENATFDKVRCNWPYHGPNGVISWPSQWCHGAAGIGLARIGILRNGSLDQNELKRDIESAIRRVDTREFNENDTLCCGCLGSIELLAEAGIELNKPELIRNASKSLAGVINNASRSGDYRWPAGNKRFNLGLYRGVSGVGYSALRRASSALPNLLIFE